MKKIIISSTFSMLAITVAMAAPIGDYTFKSPSFNGIGYSSHVLTIENQEHQREKDRQDAIQAALDKAAADASNTNISKFMNNLESRIYAQISQNVATAMFANSNCTSAGVGTCAGSFVMQYKLNPDGSQYIDPATGKAVPITSIEWKRDVDPNTFSDAIKMTVTQAGGNPTTIWVPLASFQIPGL
jgi:hypothetical protein